MVHVRTATPLDAPAIGRVIRGESPDCLVDPASDEARRFFAALEPVAIMKMMDDPARLYLVAEEKGTVVGMIMVRDKNYISQFFVTATHKGQGIGRSLWEQALKLSVAAGATGDFSVSSSMAAQHIYTRFGFVPAGEPTSKNGFKFIPMQRAASE